MNLKECSLKGFYYMEEPTDYSEFKTIGFNPEELLQVMDMTKKELIGLMVYCGIRVYKGVPLCVMTSDEMRMAYVAWRTVQIQEKREEVEPKLRRVYLWMDKLDRLLED